MRFGRIAVAEAEGARLAHTVRLHAVALKKGHTLTATNIAVLAAEGHAEIMAAQLDADDVSEDEAASAVAAAACGSGTYLGRAFTGRRSLYATTRGIADLDPHRIDELNMLDESITMATLAPHSLVAADQMVATVKINPLAAPHAIVRAAEAVAARGGPLIRVAPLRAMTAGLLQTELPGLKDRVIEKTITTVRARLEALGSSLKRSIVCAHREHDVAAVLRQLVAEEVAPILIIGASAIVDRRDVVPLGIVAAGGRIAHFGMPVDPGNLTLLAHIGETAVLGLPGSARSTRHHGGDLLLHRLLAGIAVTSQDIMRMGAGGLLKEFPGRPQPRDRPVETPPPMPRVAAIVLAAGMSRRMGARNKLLETLSGAPLIVHVVDAALGSGARPVLVVTGHDAAAVGDALRTRDLTLVHNPGFAAGLSSSLAVGLSALPAVDGAVICLGDMPHIAARHLDRLIQAFAELRGQAICVPIFGGKRGNPVLWPSGYFAELTDLSGDRGARRLLAEHAVEVWEVVMEDGAIHEDVDTPEALAAARAGTEGP